MKPAKRSKINILKIFIKLIFTDKIGVINFTRRFFFLFNLYISIRNNNRKYKQKFIQEKN